MPARKSNGPVISRSATISPPRGHPLVSKGRSLRRSGHHCRGHSVDPKGVDPQLDPAKWRPCDHQHARSIDLYDLTRHRLPLSPLGCDEGCHVDANTIALIQLHGGILTLRNCSERASPSPMEHKRISSPPREGRARVTPAPRCGAHLSTISGMRQKDRPSPFQPIRKRILSNNNSALQSPATEFWRLDNVLLVFH